VVKREQVRHYDPERPNSTVHPKWVVLFEQVRRDFLAEVVTVPIAHRAVRLRRLETLTVAAMQRGHGQAAARYLEQAAKEAGGAFTNVQVHKAGDSLAVLAQMLGMDPARIAAALDAVPAAGDAGSQGGP
jgi:hypothetical protein